MAKLYVEAENEFPLFETPATTTEPSGNKNAV